MIIAGNQLWRIKSVTIPANSTVLAEHDLVCDPAAGFVAANMWIIPVPAIPAIPGWEQIDVGAITDTTVAFTNLTSGEGGAEITINVLFVMPHTIIGPGDNDGYTRPGP